MVKILLYGAWVVWWAHQSVEVFDARPNDVPMVLLALVLICAAPPVAWFASRRALRWGRFRVDVLRVRWHRAKLAKDEA